MAADLIAFLGPSLPRREAASIAKADYQPPARQGDVWRALERRPRAIALIDGVFESQPSVWHRELLDALAEGVQVFGASSMGALRAAELHPFGMIGVGEIFRRYRDGDLIDDGEVALLHADAEHQFRPLTAPLVNVRYAAEVMRKERALTSRQATALVARAAEIFYQDRTWPRLVAGLPTAVRARVERRLGRGDLDLKALDARACLRDAAAWLLAKQGPPPLQLPPPPSHARHRRGLRSDPAPERALLAAWGRSLGLCGSDEHLARLLLEHSHRMVADGPAVSPVSRPRRPARRGG